MLEALLVFGQIICENYARFSKLRYFLKTMLFEKHGK